MSEHEICQAGAAGLADPADPRCEQILRGASGELTCVRKNGSNFPGEMRAFVAGETGEVLIIVRDLTERKMLDERLQHGQKMESIGLLASQIAHDFNNLLTGIMGNASMLLDDADPAATDRIAAIISGAELAAGLARQLLAYSGKGEFSVKDLNISHEINRTRELLESAIPKNVRLTLNLESRLPAVRMDPSQFEQVLMNLVINAGEAIGAAHSGGIIVYAGQKNITEAFSDAIGQSVAPGRYVCISVSDTGTGIPEATRLKLFDPFFTTKVAGRGLGLAAVASILRSKRAAIIVESKPGHGSTFRVLLPVVNMAPEQRTAQNGIAQRGTILVVDDDASVRDFMSTALRKHGYHVLLASDGLDAFGMLRRKDISIEAAVIDAVMPVMGAKETLPVLQTLHPNTKVLLTSGLSEVEARRLCAARPETAFIQKPYTAHQLLKAIEDIVGASKPGRAA